jgi:hypothetical protein
MRIFVAALVCLVAGVASAGESIIRVSVDRPGVVEVEQGVLAAAGLVADALVVEGPEGSVQHRATDPGAARFFADPGRLRYAHTATFLLRGLREGEDPAAAGRRAREADVAPDPAAWLRFERNLHFEPLGTEDRALLAPASGEGAPDWYYYAPPAARQIIPFQLEAAPRGAGTLHLVLQGARKRGASTGIDVSLNGEQLGAVRWTGPRAHDAELAVPEGLLTEGSNELRLRRRDGRPLLDAFRFSGIQMDAPTDPRKPLGVEVVRPAPLEAGAAEWLAIALDRLVDVVEPLAAHRKRQGLAARVVPVSAVYDRFSAGNPTPAAIRSFIAHARAHWDPAPRYVLLVGEAGRDAAWTYAPGAALPTALVDTHDNGASASDGWYGALGADCTTPDVAVGRLPSSDPEVVADLVERTVAYETRRRPGAWQRRLSFVAGEGRFGGAVDRAIEEMATQILSRNVPYDYDVDMTYASPGSPWFWTPALLSDKVVDLLGSGAAMVTYTGHGHMAGFDELRWRGRRYPIFRSEDVQRVRVGRTPPVVTIIACWTGCFDDPDDEPVGEALVEWPQGPPAVYAASRVSHPFPNALLSHDLVASYFSAGASWPRRLGDVLLEAERRLVGASGGAGSQERQAIQGYGLMFLQDPLLMQRLALDNAHLYNLLGDPALVLALAPPGGVRLQVGRARTGQPLEVRGRVEAVASGRARVSLEVTRDRFVEEPEPLAAGTEPDPEQIARNHARANRKRVVEVEATVEAGSFVATVPIPDDVWPGAYAVKALVEGVDGVAVGSALVEVELGPEDDE